jgi:hypothetical protein
MRFTKIEVQGDAGHFAVLKRNWTAPTIEVEVITPEGTRTESAPVEDPDGLWRLAAWVQQAIDGRRGCRGDVYPVFSALEHLAD